MTNENDSYNELHEIVRNSTYYSRLPPLTIECLELDGTPDTLPILIEEIYLNMETSCVSSFIKTKTSTGYNENSIIDTVQNFSKNLIKGI